MYLQLSSHIYDIKENLVVCSNVQRNTGKQDPCPFMLPKGIMNMLMEKKRAGNEYVTENKQDFLL